MDSEKLVPKCLGNGFTLGVDVELLVDLLDMTSHGVHGDKDLRRDHLVRVSLDQKLKDFSFPLREVIGLVCGQIHLGKHLQHLCSHGGGHRCTPGGGLLNVLQQLGWRGLLEDVAIGTIQERLKDTLMIVKDCQHQHTYFWMGGLDQLETFKTIDSRHIDVH